MTMSKQDFEMIAERIFTCPATAGREAAVAAHFADALRATNGQFKRDKFITAATTGAGIRRSILSRPQDNELVAEGRAIGRATQNAARLP